MPLVSPQNEVLVGAVLALLSTLVARAYLREVTVETRPGLTLDDATRAQPTTRLERPREVTVVGRLYQIVALVGMALVVHGLARMR